MRWLGTVVVILAIVLFVVVVLAVTLMSLLFPLLALAIGLLALGSLQPVLAVRALSAVPAGFVAAVDLGRVAFILLSAPLATPRLELRGVRPLPQLASLVADVARRMGQTPPDVILVTLELNFGVHEAQTSRGRVRVVEVGTPLLVALSVDELRAIIAHELAHFSLGHTTWTRILERWLVPGAAAEEAFGGGLHPAPLGIRFSRWLFVATQFALSRRHELDADAVAARHAGGDHLAAALRKTDTTAVALGASYPTIIRRARASGVAPDSLAEAATRIARTLPRPTGVHHDPFDLDGRTHPPTPLRIGALAGAPRLGPRDGRVAYAALADLRAEDHRLTAELFGSMVTVPVRQFSMPHDRRVRGMSRPPGTRCTKGS